MSGVWLVVEFAILGGFTCGMCYIFGFIVF